MLYDCGYSKKQVSDINKISRHHNQILQYESKIKFE